MRKGTFTPSADINVRGTLASAAMLAVAALVVWAASPVLFKLWLKDPIPRTQAILPLVLIHTVVGGSSAVGRSILLGMGKVKPFTISVLNAWPTNVTLSFVFVRFFGLGLRGIIYGTIVAVTLPPVWMPWYVMSAIRRGEVARRRWAPPRFPSILLLEPPRPRLKLTPPPPTPTKLPTWMSAIDSLTVGRSLVLGFALSAINPKPPDGGVGGAVDRLGGPDAGGV